MRPLLNEAGPGDSRLSALALSATILVGILMFHTISHWGRRAVAAIAAIAAIGLGFRFAYLGLTALLQ